MRKNKKDGLFAAERSFRRFARLGLDRRAMAPCEVYQTIYSVCLSRETASDMLAVYDTLRLLVAEGRGEVAEAVREVYFADERRRAHRPDLGYRVLRHAYESNCDERTVYRRLRTAAELYLRLRENTSFFGGKNYLYK